MLLPLVHLAAAQQALSLKEIKGQLKTGLCIVYN